MEGYPIELSFPTDGTGYEVGAMALIKGGPADEQENAKKFIDFMCSAEGQNLYAENNSFRVPTNSEATPAEGLVTLDSVAVIDYDAVWAADNKDEFVAQFEANIASSEKPGVRRHSFPACRTSLPAGEEVLLPNVR